MTRQDKVGDGPGAPKPNPDVLLRPSLLGAVEDQGHAVIVISLIHEYLAKLVLLERRNVHSILSFDRRSASGLYPRSIAALWR